MFQKFTIATIIIISLGASIKLQKWMPLGPLKTPTPSEKFTGWSAHGLGRIMDCVINPLDPKQIWIVSPNGGLFYTKTRGKKWKNIPLPTPGGASQISISMIPNNKIKLFIATNVTYSKRKSYSHGILSTSDLGKTWDTIRLLEPAEYRLSEIRAMEYLNNQLIYAINDTLFSYEKEKETILYKSTFKISSIKHGKLKDQWFVCGEAIAATKNNGKSFTLIKNSSSEIFKSKKCDLVYGDNKTLIISHEKNGNFFYELNKNLELANKLRTRAKVDINRNSIEYDSFRNQFLIGGVRLFSFNSSQKLEQITRPLFPHEQHVHDDIRKITFDAYGNILVAHDAGISLTENGGKKWYNINGCGLNITEFYGFDFNDGKLVAGAQDLSSFIYNQKEKKWSHISSLYGDGGSCLIENDTWYIMRGRQLMKSTNNGITFKYENFPKQIAGFDPIMKNLEGQKYLANKHLWLFKNKRWYDISIDIENNYTISGIAIKKNFIILSKEDPVWRSQNLKGKLFRSNTSGKNWQDITSNFKAYAYREISDICFGEENEDAIYACIGSFDASKGTRQKVYTSNDYGDSWNNISFNLPNTPCNVIKDIKGIGLLVGTNRGLFILKDKQWEKFGQELPEVPVTQIKQKGDKIIVSTYGRGLWVLN